MSKQQIGETRSAMSEDLLEEKLWKVAKEAHDEKKLNEFWIVISHRFDDYLVNVIREGIVVTNKKPPHMINSMCFHVVWDRGILEPEWILPQDHGIGVGIPEEGCGGASSLVYDSLNEIGGGKILL